MTRKEKAEEKALNWGRYDGILEIANDWKLDEVHPVRRMLREGKISEALEVLADFDPSKNSARDR